jgi:hypothetical protein
MTSSHSNLKPAYAPGRTSQIATVSLFPSNRILYPCRGSSCRERRRESVLWVVHQAIKPSTSRSAPGTTTYESRHDSIMLPFLSIAPRYFPVFLVLTKCSGRWAALALVPFRNAARLNISHYLHTARSHRLSNHRRHQALSILTFATESCFLHCQLSA